MTRNVPPAEIPSYMEEKLNALLHACVLESDARLKLATPVDVGRMRNAWTISQNSPFNTTADLGATEDKQPAKVYAAPTSVAVRINRTAQRYSNYSRGQEKVGNQYFISNNVTYAEPIAYGTGLPRSWGGKYRSIQTTPGYPDLIAKTMERWLEGEWKRMTVRDD